MNDENRYRVYILRHQTPRSHGPFLGMDEEHFNVSALEPSLEFLSLLKENIAGLGDLFTGPSRDTDQGIVTEHVVCLFKPWREMWKLPDVCVRVAEGEIFEGADGLYYVKEDVLIKLEGETLHDFFDGDHGRRVPNLDVELNRHLRKSCRHECRSLGYNGAALREIMPRWIEAVWTKPPREWTWSWLNQELMRIVEEFQMALGHKMVWYVYEQLQSEDIFITSPMADGAIVTEIIEAAVDDLPGVRQWLIKALPVFEFMNLRAPELETVRHLEEHEVFCSRRGAVWIQEGRGVQLGEIAGEIVADRHGAIVSDLSEQARRAVLDLVLAEIEKQGVVAPFDEVAELVHDIIDEEDPLKLWFKSASLIAGRILEKLNLQKIL